MGRNTVWNTLGLTNFCNIYPKRDNKHPYHFHVGDPLSSTLLDRGRMNTKENMNVHISNLFDGNAGKGHG